jgi:hypothetical protein
MGEEASGKAVPLRRGHFMPHDTFSTRFKVGLCAKTSALEMLSFHQ